MTTARNWIAPLGAALLALPLLLAGQAGNGSDPLANALRASLKSMSGRMVAAADEMPANKYDFKPTTDQMSFGQLILHVSTSNESLCATISGAAPAAKTDLTAASSKDDLMNLLKSSFDYCNTAFANLTDAGLDSQVGGGMRKMTKAAAIMALNGDWEDHYSQQAMYLRLNGLLPPTAQGRGRGR